MVNRHDLRALMAKSVDWMGKTLLPEECIEEFSPVHQMLWTKLTTSVNVRVKDYVKFAIGLPRGHAKTQLLKFLCIYIITETKRRFILVICNTASMARVFVNDVIGLLSSDNASSVYGDWREEVLKDNEEHKIFKFNGRTIILKPMGIGSSVLLRTRCEPVAYV